MNTYQSELRAELGFGDICDADFLYDVHVRRDSRSMGRLIAKAKFTRTWGINGDAPYFVPALDPGQDESYVLAHGVHQQALILSDDCLVASALGRDRGVPTSRRLLFAPLVDATDEETAELEVSNFGRFPLRADSQFAEHRVVDLRRCYMADARDVHQALQAGSFRLRSLSDEARDELAIRWSAFALRRGPFVAEDSLEKFAEYLLDSKRVASDDVAVAVALSLANVVAAAWGYEGRGVECAGTAAEDGRPVQEAIDMLVTELGKLRDTVTHALEALGTL